MDFFGIGFGEIVLILVLALIVFGPGKLPEAARTAGRYVRALRKMSSEFTQAVSKEMELDEETKKIGSDLKDLKNIVPKVDISLADEKSAPAYTRTAQSVKDVPPPAPPTANVTPASDAGAGQPKA